MTATTDAVEVRHPRLRAAADPAHLGVSNVPQPQWQRPGQTGDGLPGGVRREVRDHDLDGPRGEGSGARAPKSHLRHSGWLRAATTTVPLADVYAALAGDSAGSLGAFRMEASGSARTGGSTKPSAASNCRRQWARSSEAPYRTAQR